jgi:hypothetical protein
LISLIESFNSFSIQQTDANGVFLNDSGNGIDKNGAGLWVNASRFNHSCLQNAYRVFHGDFMFVYANQPISKGQEITLTYIPAQKAFPERQKMIGKYRFECSCPLCISERSLPELKMKKLVALTKEFDVLKQHIDKGNGSEATFRDLKNMVIRMKTEYGKKKTRLNMMLMEPLSYLARAYRVW